MGSLVKVVGDQLCVSNYRVAGPGYILYVSEGRSAYGWNYIADTVTEEDYVAYWTEDTIYQKGDQVSYLGSIWESTLDDNVWEPGISGWFDTVAANTWIQPTGAHDAYQTNDQVTHNEQIWTSTIDANVWEPGVYGWVID